MKFTVDIPDSDSDLIARRFRYEPEVHDEEKQKYVPNKESKAAFVARQVQGLITKEANHQMNREAEEAAKKATVAARNKGGGVTVTVKE